MNDEQAEARLGPVNDEQAEARLGPVNDEQATPAHPRNDESRRS
ncbi:MAG: hypothetical protein OXH78_06465 [Acidimicrobiaceae bacterium]|nr:hypothetical protein [Acidimicrobiaceae bacterium]